MTTALVLSGGGARGDFEVGAVRYLYDHGVQPQIICGTSVGAINGVKLAEGGNEALGGLENIWLQLQSVDQMFGLAEWVTALPPEAISFVQNLAGRSRNYPARAFVDNPIVSVAIFLF